MGKRYTRAEPDNPKYAGIYFYNGAKSRSIVITYRDNNGKQKRQKIGNDYEVTLEDAYKARQKILGKKAVPSSKNYLEELLSSFHRGREFMKFHKAHEGKLTFSESALAFLIIHGS